MDDAIPNRAADSLRQAGERARRHDPALARRSYEEAVALLRQTAETLKLAHTLRHLGDVYCEAGETALAEPCYIEALALYRAHPLPPPLHLANAIRAAAMLQVRLGHSANALPLWAEARALYAACGIDAGVEECSRHMAGD